MEFTPAAATSTWTSSGPGSRVGRPWTSMSSEPGLLHDDCAHPYLPYSRAARGKLVGSRWRPSPGIVRLTDRGWGSIVGSDRWRAGAISSALAAAVALLAVACGSSPEAESGHTSSPATRPGDGVVLLTAEPAAPGERESIMEAGVGGTVVINAAGCVALQSSPEHEPAPLVAPTGSRVEEDATTIELAGLGGVRVGDVVEGGGGHFEYASLDEVPEEWRACVTIDRTEIGKRNKAPFRILQTLSDQ